MVDRRVDFREQPPAKDWNERITRAQTTVQKNLTKYERKIQELGEKIDAKIDEKGWREKVGNFFKDKFKKNKNDNNITTTSNSTLLTQQNNDLNN